MRRKGKIGRDPKVGSSLWSEPDSGLRLWAGYAQSLGGMLRVSNVSSLKYLLRCIPDFVDDSNNRPVPN